jgi:CRISPR-associated protein Cmr1
MYMKITIQTLTPLWTGGVDQTCDRMHETGLIGSLRWWYEALVRGLDGYTCDPTGDDRCPGKDGKHCVACELFGCTGWARKFRLRGLDANGQVIQNPVQEDVEFTLEFIELRSINPEEKWLLTKSVEIAARYGSVGGKTTLKPQKGPMGKDYGIIKWIRASDVQKPKDIAAFLQSFRQGNHLPQHPNLSCFFFFSGAFLTRLQMNPLLGMDQNVKCLPDPDDIQKFLQGKRGSAQQDAISKKLFSFKAGGGRIWGYARDPGMRDEIVARIERQLGSAKFTVKTGEEVLHEL